jgi:hypothetical protein
LNGVGKVQSLNLSTAFANWLTEVLRRARAEDESLPSENQSLVADLLDRKVSEVRMLADAEWSAVAGGTKVDGRYPWDSRQGTATEGEAAILARANIIEADLGGTSPVAMYPTGVSQPHESDSARTAPFFWREGIGLKTYRRLYSTVWDWDNLFLAYRKARKGKRGKRPAAEFEYCLSPANGPTRGSAPTMGCGRGGPVCPPGSTQSTAAGPTGGSAATVAWGGGGIACLPGSAQAPAYGHTRPHS